MASTGMHMHKPWHNDTQETITLNPEYEWRNMNVYILGNLSQYLQLVFSLQEKVM